MISGDLGKQRTFWRLSHWIQVSQDEWRPCESLSDICDPRCWTSVTMIVAVLSFHSFCSAFQGMFFGNHHRSKHAGVPPAMTLSVLKTARFGERTEFKTFTSFTTNQWAYSPITGVATGSEPEPGPKGSWFKVGNSCELHQHLSTLSSFGNSSVSYLSLHVSSGKRASTDDFKEGNVRLHPTSSDVPYSVPLQAIFARYETGTLSLKVKQIAHSPTLLDSLQIMEAVMLCG